LIVLWYAMPFAILWRQKADGKSVVAFEPKKAPRSS
jgi:hypothetical protein